MFAQYAPVFMASWPTIRPVANRRNEWAQIYLVFLASTSVNFSLSVIKTANFGGQKPEKRAL